MQRALQRLAERASASPPDATLLPRTAGVVPQVLAQLRGPAWSLPVLAEHVSRDVTLVAETLALANGALYRHGEAVVDLAQAIRVLGADGLRRAVARIVFRPVADPRSGELAARGAAWLWTHTDRKAQLCAALAQDAGLDPFDAYLLALVHGAGWGVVLRALDAAQAGPVLRPGPALAAALAAARDGLCLPIARHWQLPPALLRPA
ncbi:MAG: HDOD domain-containing protein, partial [Burkholderiales bacterium]|nr:HDOD domain-containing protein [Burkholderiales bacterium]